MLSGGGKHITQSPPGTLASGWWVWVPDVQGRWMIPMDGSRMILVEVLKQIPKKREKKIPAWRKGPPDWLGELMCV